MMNINTRKTNGMVLGPLSRDPPPQIIIGDLTVERVSQFKLLGIIVSDKLKWNDNVANISLLQDEQAPALSQATETSRNVNE